MKVCMVAQFPPPIHGLSKAVDTLYRSRLHKKFNFTKIDTTNNFKFLKTLFLLLTSKADLFYITVSQSRGGNLRDVIIMTVLALRGKKFGIHTHGGLHYREVIDHEIPEWQRQLNLKLLQRVEFAIALSPRLKANYEGLVPEENIRVIENGVDQSTVPNDKQLKRQVESRLSQSVLHVLFLSNLIESKGYKLVLEMAKLEHDRILAGQSQRFAFDFAGAFFADSESQYFSQYIKENNLEDVVVYHGIVSGVEKQALLSQCSVFCLPTHYPIEGQPISILEAMANGQFIISTDVASIPDMVKSSVYGMLFKPTELSEKVYHFLQSLTPQMLMVASQEAVHQYNETFTEEAYIDKFDNLFSLLDDSN